MSQKFEWVYGVDSEKPYRHTFVTDNTFPLSEREYTNAEIENFVSSPSWWTAFPDATMFAQAMAFAWQYVFHADTAEYFAANIYLPSGGGTLSDDFELVASYGNVNFNFGFTLRPQRIVPNLVAGFQGRGSFSKGNRLYAVGLLNDFITFATDDASLPSPAALDLANPPTFAQIAAIYEAYQSNAPVQYTNSGVNRALQDTILQRKLYKGVRRA